MYDKELETALDLLKAWLRSEWTDFIKEKESPLMFNTKKFIESVEGES
jgi:hypothetical protein